MAKILISLPAELLAELDAYCQELKYNRSEFLRFLVRQELKATGGVEGIRAVDKLLNEKSF